MRFLPLLVVVIAAGPVFAVQDTTPTQFPSSRYDQMLDNSPFRLATPDPIIVKPAHFFDGWILTGIAALKDELGVERDFVSIMSRDQTQRYSLFGSEPNEDGVSIARIERSPLAGRSKVTLKKGEEYGTVEFDQMLMQQPPSVPPAVRGKQGTPGTPAVPRSSQVAPNGIPGQQPVNDSRGISRSSAPSSDLPQVNNGAAPVPAMPRGSNPRQRVRVTDSKP